MKDKGDFHLQLYATSPSPKRDYHGLTITSTHITLNSWDISHGPHVYPRRRRLSLDNLSMDKAFCNEVQVLFGRHVLEYAQRVAHEDAGLYTLPEKVFRRLVKYLAVGDVVRLGQTSKIFFELCNTNSIWKIIFQKKLKRPPSKTELDISTTMSWRHMLYRRVHDKTETKKIYENFKHGVENLRRESSKEAEKIRKNTRVMEPLIQDRKPPEDKFKSNKISIKTFKIGDQTNAKIASESKRMTSTNLTNQKVTRNEKTSAAASSHKVTPTSQKTVKNISDKPNKSTSNLITGVNKKIVDKTEKKVEKDMRTKSTSQLHYKKDSTKTTDKSVKLNKSAKELQNLKSKSVLL